MEGTPGLRRRIRRSSGPSSGRGDVLFDPFTLVAHATDATDWRLHLPVAVVLPSDRGAGAAAAGGDRRLGLTAIPRGAGTGLTGGAVPLRPGCVVVNTERLDRIRGIEVRAFALADGRTVQAPVMEVEAGVVTERAMEDAAARGLVFATDPTSAWACTIGGNIAENAGGKTACSGAPASTTCSPGAWRCPAAGASPCAGWTTRCARSSRATRSRSRSRTSAGAPLRTVALAGDEIRRPGLWKDITNKALGGLPGLQKEGTDGVITSAEFILHREYPARRTLCLEFFGRTWTRRAR